MSHSPKKVKVTVEDRSGTRSYEADYVFLSLLDSITEKGGEGVDGRWLQFPQDWKKGMGLFLSALEALKVVAEEKGEEAFKVAARAALSSMKPKRSYSKKVNK